MKKRITKESSLTIKDLKEFIKDIPEEQKVYVYAVGFNSFDSWKSDVVGLTHKENKLFIDFNNIF